MNISELAKAQSDAKSARTLATSAGTDATTAKTSADAAKATAEQTKNDVAAVPLLTPDSLIVVIQTVRRP